MSVSTLHDNAAQALKSWRGLLAHAYANDDDLSASWMSWRDGRMKGMTKVKSIAIARLTDGRPLFVYTDDRGILWCHSDGATILEPLQLRIDEVSSSSLRCLCRRVRDVIRPYRADYRCELSHRTQKMTAAITAVIAGGLLWRQVRR